MPRISRKCKGIFSLVVFFLLVFYIEVLSYILNTKHWKPFVPGGTPHPDPEIDEKGPLRVLLVADPQIQGENNELPFLGLFTRWDADRYLQRNYMLAKYHVHPHVVIFLGDLFDEGSTATDMEYRRYYRRFADIFQLPRKQDPSPINYIFLPGDNDVGGEGVEPVDPIKLKWFNQTFGDFGNQLRIDRNNLNLQFLKMNLFLLDADGNHIHGPEALFQGAVLNADIRILLSHVSLLQYKTNAVEKILEKTKPQLVFAAHSHESSYFQLENKDGLKATHRFLMAHNHPSVQWSWSRLVKNNWASSSGDSNTNSYDSSVRGVQIQDGIEFRSYNYDEESKLLQTSSAITLKLDKGTNPAGIIHEINVPTCSYRMGVPNMGFGAFTLHPDGRLEYTVLWLPSRFNQLQAYLYVYLCMKVSVIFWIFIRLYKYVAQQCKGPFRGVKHSYKKVDDSV